MKREIGKAEKIHLFKISKNDCNHIYEMAKNNINYYSFIKNDNVRDTFNVSFDCVDLSINYLIYCTETARTDLIFVPAEKMNSAIFQRYMFLEGFNSLWNNYPPIADYEYEPPQEFYNNENFSIIYLNLSMFKDDQNSLMTNLLKYPPHNNICPLKWPSNVNTAKILGDRFKHLCLEHAEQCNIRIPFEIDKSDTLQYNRELHAFQNFVENLWKRSKDSLLELCYKEENDMRSFFSKII